MFIIDDTTTAALGTDARELVQAADTLIQDHYGSLLPKDRAALYESWMGVEGDEIAADDFFDHYVEFSVLFPQLPDEVVLRLTQCTLRAVNLPMMGKWESVSAAEKIQSSIVNTLRDVADSYELSEVQGEILKAIEKGIAGGSGRDEISLPA